LAGSSNAKLSVSERKRRRNAIDPVIGRRILFMRCFCSCDARNIFPSAGDVQEFEPFGVGNDEIFSRLPPSPPQTKRIFCNRKLKMNFF